MASLLIKSSNIVLTDGSVTQGAVLVRDGVIVEIGSSSASADKTVELGDAYLLPGLIDIHNHGAVGIDVNEASADDLRKVGAFLVEHGVTSWMPTFVPDSVETYTRVTGAMHEVVSSQGENLAARIVGVHYEGIFANTQMCGALRPEYFRKFTGSELNDIPRLEGCAHLTTFAPEVDGGIELVKALVGEGWVPSIGHTRADFQTLESAYAAGARHVTHLFNAMTGLHHREIGVVGWVLGKKGVTADIIADGIHVAPEVLKITFDAKSADGLVLISDSVAPTGKGDGNFELWGEKINVTAGRTRNERGSIAGSVITMADAVKTFRSVGASYGDIAKMGSSNPARLLGLKDRGAIEKGKRGDLVAFDGEGRLVFSSVGGQVARDILQ